MYSFLFIICFIYMLSATAIASCITCSDYSNEDDDYGKTWMYIPDGDGVPQVAYLTEEDAKSRTTGRKDVKDMVRFELYRR